MAIIMEGYDLALIGSLYAYGPFVLPPSLAPCFPLPQFFLSSLQEKKTDQFLFTCA